MSGTHPARDGTNLPEASKETTSLQPSSSEPQYHPSNADTDNPRLPPHFFYSPAMNYPNIEDGTDMGERYDEFEAVLDAYMRDFASFKSAIVGMHIIGREFYDRPSETNPLVVTMIIETTDVPRVTRQIHEECLRLVRQYFAAPVPPFRFYVNDMVPYAESMTKSHAE